MDIHPVLRYRVCRCEVPVQEVHENVNPRALEVYQDIPALQRRVHWRLHHLRVKQQDGHRHFQGDQLQRVDPLKEGLDEDPDRVQGRAQTEGGVQEKERSKLAQQVRVNQPRQFPHPAFRRSRVAKDLRAAC